MLTTERYYKDGFWNIAVVELGRLGQPVGRVSVWPIPDIYNLSEEELAKMAASALAYERKLLQCATPTPA